MNAIHEPTQEEIDAALERQISTAYLAAINANDADLARAGFKTMGELIAQRSPRQIACMEARLPRPWRS